MHFAVVVAAACLVVVAGATGAPDTPQALYGRCFPDSPSTASLLADLHASLPTAASQAESARSAVLVGSVDDGVWYATELLSKAFDSTLHFNLAPAARDVEGTSQKLLQSLRLFIRQRSSSGSSESRGLVVIRGLDRLSGKSLRVLNSLLAPLDSRSGTVPASEANDTPLSTSRLSFLLVFTTRDSVDDAETHLQTAWTAESEEFTVHPLLGRIGRFVALPHLPKSAVNAWRSARAHNHHCGQDPRNVLVAFLGHVFRWWVGFFVASGSKADTFSTTSPGDVYLARHSAVLLPWLAWLILGLGLYLFFLFPPRRPVSKSVLLGTLGLSHSSLPPESLENPVTVEPSQFRAYAGDPLASPRPSPEPATRSRARSRSRSRSRTPTRATRARSRSQSRPRARRSLTRGR